MSEIKMKTLFALSCITASLALSGCGLKVEQREVASGNLLPMERVFYPVSGMLQSGRGDQILQNNKLFLWKKGTSAAVTENVIRAGDQADVNEQLAKSARAELRLAESEVENANLALEEALESAGEALAENIKDRFAELRQKLDERATLPPDDKEAAETLDGEIAELHAELERAQPPLPAGIAAAKAAQSTAYYSYGSKFLASEKIAEESYLLVQTVIQNTDYFQEGPDRVTIRFEGSRIEITINNWPSRGIIHSTERGTIRDVSYVAEGGRLEFLVQTAPGQEYFRFRVMRTRHFETEQTAGKAVFYIGDLDQFSGDAAAHSEGRIPTRYGVVKLGTKFDE